MDLSLVVFLLDLTNLCKGVLDFDLVLVGERFKNLLLGVLIELEQLVKVEIIFAQYLVENLMQKNDELVEIVQPS